MGLDIRLPMGLMFSVLGLILSVYGAVTQFRSKQMYERHSLGINVNLWWGLVILAFGVIMLLLAWRAAKNPNPPLERSEGDQVPPRPGH